MKPAVSSFICLISGVLSTSAAQLSLAWDPSSDPSAIGYAVYVGSASGSYQQRVDAGAHTNLTLTNLTSGVWRYFTVRAYNSANLESLPSNEVSYLIPGSIYLSGAAPNSMRVNWVGEPGKTYHVEASTNLINWSVIKVIQPPSNSWAYWDDPESRNLNKRYYRVVIAP